MDDSAQKGAAVDRASRRDSDDGAVVSRSTVLCEPFCCRIWVCDQTLKLTCQVLLDLLPDVGIRVQCLQWMNFLGWDIC